MESLQRNGVIRTRVIVFVQLLFPVRNSKRKEAA
jgi:hypothetical protein